MITAPATTDAQKVVLVILMIAVNTTLIFLRYLFYIKINKSLLIIDYNKFIVFFFDVLGMYKFVFNTESQL